MYTRSHALVILCGAYLRLGFCSLPLAQSVASVPTRHAYLIWVRLHCEKHSIVCPVIAHWVYCLHSPLSQSSLAREPSGYWGRSFAQFTLLIHHMDFPDHRLALKLR